MSEKDWDEILQTLTAEERHLVVGTKGKIDVEWTIGDGDAHGKPVLRITADGVSLVEKFSGDAEYERRVTAGYLRRRGHAPTEVDIDAAMLEDKRQREEYYARVGIGKADNT